MLAFYRLLIYVCYLGHFGKLCVAIPVGSKEQITAREQDFGSNTPSGRGLVLCAGGNDLLVRAIALVSTIRFHLQSEVPIQLFYAGAGEISPQIRQYFHKNLQVTTTDALPIIRRYYKNVSAKDLQGFQIKPFALAESMFEEVMLVDADVLFFQPPEILWTNASYQATGTMFFYDFITHWHAPGAHPRRFLRTLLATIDRRAFKSYNYSAESRDSISLRNKDTGWCIFCRTRQRDLDDNCGVNPSEKGICNHGEWKSLYTIVEMGYLLGQREIAHASSRTFHEMDSSVVLWNKAKLRSATRMLRWLNRVNTPLQKAIYHHLWGDKETYWLSCQLTMTKYSFSSFGASLAGDRSFGGVCQDTGGGHAHYGRFHDGTRLLFINSKHINADMWVSRARPSRDDMSGGCMTGADPLGAREAQIVQTYLEFAEDAKFLVGTAW